MTDDEERPIEDSNTEASSTSIPTAIVRIIAVVGLIILVIVLLGGPLLELYFTSPTKLGCYVVAETDEGNYSAYMNETWIESDEIKRYEDIPKKVRRNLSDEAKSYLRNNNEVDYTPLKYQNLPEGETRLFRKAAESGSPVTVKLAEPPRAGLTATSASSIEEKGHIIYNDTVYNCQMLDPDSRGA